MGLLALTLMVKGCQGICYHGTAEYRIHRLGYPIDQARAIAGVLSAEQAHSLISRGEHDTIAYPIIKQRYFIARNFDHYLAFHKVDSVASLDDIVTVVNVGDYPDEQKQATHCDTSKGQLMLVNGMHYLDENYQPDSLEAFERTCCYENQQAIPAVVRAFVAMQRDCKTSTGAQLMVNSAYRSFQDQIAIYKRSDKGYAAHAGRSEHQTGLAIDVTSLQHPMRWPFDASVECAWMHEHCHEYGFILRYPKKQSQLLGYNYEPWHLRYVGVPTATRIHNEGITFDEYYAYYIDREKQ